MTDLIITTGSVTSAMRLEKTLNNAGIINVAVIHTPPAINSGGCSYSVRVPYKYIHKATEILGNKKVKFKKLYAEEIQSEGRSYNALS